MTASEASVAYALWIEGLIARGLEPWFVTFMFRPLLGSAASQQQQMLAAVEVIYGIRITRAIKHPRSASNRDRRPIWLATPDLPVFKHLKQTLQVILINDGLHVHAIVLETADRRCPESLAEFVWAERQLWQRLCPDLERIDVRAITYDIPRVTSYLFKQIERRVSADSVLILPRTNDELRRGARRIGQHSPIYGRARAYPSRSRGRTV